jgi:hypothetical protein
MTSFLPCAEAGVKVSPDVAGTAQWGMGLPMATDINVPLLVSLSLGFNYSE